MAMKLSAAVVVLAAAPAAAVTPVQKVIQLLDGMQSKGKAAKHEEEVGFAKFAEWCDGLRAVKTKSIEDGASAIIQLEADVEKSQSDAEVLAGEIADLQAAVAEAQKEVKSATALRDKEHADYQTQHTDFSESIDAIERALQVLRSRSADVPQSLMQVQRSVLVPEQAKQVLATFLALGADAAAKSVDGLGAPEANAYEFQSGSVITILEKLALRFKDERLALEKAEINAKSNYEMLKQQLHDNINNDESTSAKKTSAKAGRLEDAAKAKSDLAMTQKTKANDEQVLSDTNAECHAKSDEYEKNQVTRAEEIKAIEKAIEILSSGEVSGHAETHLPALLQARKSSSLVQLSGEGSPDLRKKALTYLQGRAKALGSRYLSVMADHAADDPFDKVKKMIKDLIVRLMQEANDEADHHAYCTTELATNKQTREDKSAEVDELSAKVEQLTSQIAQLADEISHLSDALSNIAAEQAQATQLRVEEKAQNGKTVSDAKEAQLAVEQAIQVLRGFYGSSGSAALLQSGKAAHKSNEPYEGMHGESGGVMGLLDVILSDFSRLESETSMAEDIAQSAHEKYMAESTQDAAVQTTEKEHKEGNKRRAEEALHSTQKELSLTQEELNTALEYYEKLKPDCVNLGLSTEERKRQREEEIQSLKEALSILNGEDVA